MDTIHQRMLEYDNSAFYYFAVTLLTIYILPASCYFISEVVSILLGFDDDDDEDNEKNEIDEVKGGLAEEENSKSNTKDGKSKATKKSKDKKQKGKAKTNEKDQEKDKEKEDKEIDDLLQQLAKKSAASAKENKPKGWAKISIKNAVILFIAWILYVYLIVLLMDNSRVGASSFDPFQILNVAHTATEGEIKRAYRKLSLKYHPDKNVGDRAAAEMFVKISKAYETLTNPKAKENFEKFGNPDGKSSFEVSIGLPKFLIENPKVVLLFYFLSLVIIIPGVVYYCYSENQNLAEKERKQQEAMIAALPSHIRRKLMQQENQLEFDD